jgi:hypothetical protein
MMAVSKRCFKVLHIHTLHVYLSSATKVLLNSLKKAIHLFAIVLVIIKHLWGVSHEVGEAFLLKYNNYKWNEHGVSLGLNLKMLWASNL